jgi:magnesium chelatase accessory protein
MTGTGPDVLLLHGAGARRILASHDAAARRPFRLIAPDLPGHGFTQSPRGRSSLPQVARDIAALMDKHGGRPAHRHRPFGRRRHRAGIARQGLLDLDRIVVINGALEDFRGPAGVVFPIMARMMAMNPLTGLFLSRGSSEAQVRGLIGATGSDLRCRGLALYARLIARRVTCGRDTRHDGAMVAEGAWRGLADIRVPTLFLHGGERPGGRAFGGRARRGVDAGCAVRAFEVSDISRRRKRRTSSPLRCSGSSPRGGRCGRVETDGKGRARRPPFRSSCRPGVGLLRGQRNQVGVEVRVIGIAAHPLGGHRAAQVLARLLRMKAGRVLDVGDEVLLGDLDAGLVQGLQARRPAEILDVAEDSPATAVEVRAGAHVGPSGQDVARVVHDVVAGRALAEHGFTGSRVTGRAMRIGMGHAGGQERCRCSECKLALHG